MTLFVQPLVGSVLGLLVLREPQSTGLYIGGALILVAMLVATVEPAAVPSQEKGAQA
jgi:drug/metabolite transporter (DMT)-like permease